VFSVFFRPTRTNQGPPGATSKNSRRNSSLTSSEVSSSCILIQVRCGRQVRSSLLPVSSQSTSPRLHLRASPRVQRKHETQNGAPWLLPKCGAKSLLQLACHNNVYTELLCPMKDTSNRGGVTKGPLMEP